MWCSRWSQNTQENVIDASTYFKGSYDLLTNCSLAQLESSPNLFLPSSPQSERVSGWALHIDQRGLSLHGLDEVISDRFRQ